VGNEGEKRAPVLSTQKFQGVHVFERKNVVVAVKSLAIGLGQHGQVEEHIVHHLTATLSFN